MRSFSGMASEPPILSAADVSCRPPAPQGRWAAPFSTADAARYVSLWWFSRCTRAKPDGPVLWRPRPDESAVSSAMLLSARASFRSQPQAISAAPLTRARVSGPHCFRFEIANWCRAVHPRFGSVARRHRRLAEPTATANSAVTQAAAPATAAAAKSARRTVSRAFAQSTNGVVDRCYDLSLATEGNIAQAISSRDGITWTKQTIIPWRPGHADGFVTVGDTLWHASGSAGTTDVYKTTMIDC